MFSYHPVLQNTRFPSSTSMPITGPLLSLLELAIMIPLLAKSISVVDFDRPACSYYFLGVNVKYLRV